MGGGWPESTPSPRFIFHRMMRRDQLCPGPEVCPYVLMDNPRPGPDPAPCAECPKELLDEYLRSTAGRLIANAIDLDFALQAGVTITLAEISYPEFLLLRYLAEERNKYQEEQIKAASDHGQQPHIPTGRSQF
jgi:hypothetical protein